MERAKTPLCISPRRGGEIQRGDRLEEAMATLLQTQASFLAQMAEIDRRIAETERINSERFARIETILLDHGRILADHSRVLADHSRILADHSRILQALPDA